MKKYLLSILMIVPLVLSLVPFSSSAVASSSFYSYYYLVENLINFPRDDAGLDKPENFLYSPPWDSTKKHFYCIYAIGNHNAGYIENRNGNINLEFAIYEFSSDVPTSDNDYNISFSSCKSWHKLVGIYTGSPDYTFFNRNFFTTGDFYNSTTFTYDKTFGTFGSNLSTSQFQIYYQWSDIEDFPFADGVDHPVDDSLNVLVSFKPNLTGDVSRELRNSEGDLYLASQMRMNVTNNCPYPIQYRFFISAAEYTQNEFDGNVILNPPTSENPNVFEYYSNDWVYSHSLDSSNDLFNEIPQKHQKTTNWHYVPPGQSVSVLFNYSQINLIENKQYYAYVVATRCDYDLASEKVINFYEEINPTLYHVYVGSPVYQSSFKMLHYSDVKYNYSDTSNGVMPYRDNTDRQRYSYSYNAIETENGIDYTGKDVYSDPNSWFNHPESWGGYVPSGSDSSDDDFVRFSSRFQSFFAFIMYIFNYLPSDFKVVFLVGFSSVVVLSVIMVVFRS